MNQTYGRLVSRAAIAATVMASLLLLIKIFAWWYTGSVSILAALVDSLVDIAASLTNLLVVRYSLQPADDEHTFGHGKAESLAALAQSMFISGSALFLFLTGIQHLITPTPMNEPGVGIVVTLIALVCTIILVTFQRWVVRKTQSQAVRADMLHYQSDVMMNGSDSRLRLGWPGMAGIARTPCLRWESASIFYTAHYVWDMRQCSRYWIARCPMRNVRKLLIS
ncbi:ferrous iron efflux protein F [Citrobacter koseri]|uniref:Ferrous iron efflux protein F n=1 Tax=Citrobacter koseri TaxID=545 RepID=A0A2X2YU28_CITKO|nr:ferrous iron efflux protein F [Citrobacter koseri]